MEIWHQFVAYFSDGLQALANFYSFLGGHRWAAAIITLTLIVRTLLLPLAIKQIRGMRDTQRLQPELQRLRQKHRNDRQKLTQETMELFRREGVNPYAACLPLVAQAPVFIGIYQALQKLTSVPGDVAKELAPIAKRTGSTVLDIAQGRGIVPEMPFLGLGDLAHPAKSSIAGILLIAIMTLAQLVTTRQLNPGTTDQQRRLQMLMPFMFIFLFISFPAGLVLYWATQSLYQLVQQMIMTRDMRKDTGGWRSLFRWKPPGRTGPARKEPKRAPVPVAATASAPAGAGGFSDAETRRVLAEKRRRRRRKKKKRR